jgi:hypothetical protein
MPSTVSLLRRALRAVPTVALAMGCGASNAQSGTPSDAASKSTPAEAPAAQKSGATSTTSPGEPGTRRLLIEDDNTRIEELHVRGEAQRVVVQSKRVNLPAWEIRPDSPGRTSAGEQRLPRDTANTRMWRVMSF